jgi:hypothetical protein
MIKKMYVILLILFFINVANDIGKGIIFDENNEVYMIFGQHQ